jgi:hypothetical protein
MWTDVTDAMPKINTYMSRSRMPTATEMAPMMMPARALPLPPRAPLLEEILPRAWKPSPTATPPTTAEINQGMPQQHPKGSKTTEMIPSTIEGVEAGASIATIP